MPHLAYAASTAKQLRSTARQGHHSLQAGSRIHWCISVNLYVALMSCKFAHISIYVETTIESSFFKILGESVPETADMIVVWYLARDSHGFSSKGPCLWFFVGLSGATPRGNPVTDRGECSGLMG